MGSTHFGLLADRHRYTCPGSRRQSVITSIGARVRSQRSVPRTYLGNGPLESRLPQWMLAAKHRERVVRGLQSLRGMVGAWGANQLPSVLVAGTVRGIISIHFTSGPIKETLILVFVCNEDRFLKYCSDR